MFDAVPVRFWFLLLIAIIAWVPIRYVYRHVTQSPSRRDITQPPDDLSWRSSRALAKNVGILAVLAATAAFIFTPAATELAQAPNLFPILAFGLGAFAIWSVMSGYRSGEIEPMLRGLRWTFTRAEHPKRYWASMGWNGLLGLGLLISGGQVLADAPVQTLQDRCYDWKTKRSAQEELDACNRLLADHPDEDRSNVVAARGSAYYRLGDYRRARSDYAAAIRLDPKVSSNHYNLGLVDDLLGNRESAIVHYSAAIETDPKNAEAFANRGFIYLDTGRFDQAVADLTRAHSLQPKNVTTLANRGISYAWKGDVVRAEQDFAVVRRSEPSNLVVLHGEGLLAMTRGDMTAGIRAFSAAIARDPDDAWAFGMRSAAYRRLGDPDRMKADAEKAQLLQSKKVRDRTRW